MAVTKQPLRMVRITQPLCSRVFGTAPCLATGEKCYNTDVSCKFRTALSLTNTLTQDFVQEGYEAWVNVAGAYQPSLAISALVDYDTAPTELNVADGSRDSSPLGYRGVVSLTIKDFPWNDLGTDPYPTSRASNTNGSYWSKWLARNPFHVGYKIDIYEGEIGDTLAAMTRRTYEIEKINRTRSQVQITAKDVLRRITDTGITAPKLSSGVLASGITSTATSFTVAGALVADYPSPGYVRINSELIEYLSASGTNAIVFSGLTRGSEGTTAANHSQNERVQWVLDYDDVRCDAIIDDLLTVQAGISTAYRNIAAWTAETDEWRPEFSFRAFITEPTKIETLLGEVLSQSLMHLWWDERTSLIQLKAQKPDAAPQLITDDADIIAGSFSVREFPERRASDVRVYYNLRTPISDLNDPKSYANGADRIDATKIGQYGQATVKELFCRWIQSSAIATTLAASYGGRFADTRREITFDMASDTVWTGDAIVIRHFDDVDLNGAARDGDWLVTSAEALIDRFRYVAEDNDMVGKLWAWVDDTIPVWASATPTQKATIGYWLDDNDLDQDGNPQPWRWL